MSGESPIGKPDKREDDRFIGEQFPHQGQQILIGERIRIEPLDHGQVIWQAFAYFDFADHFSIIDLAGLKWTVNLSPKITAEAKACYRGGHLNSKMSEKVYVTHINKTVLLDVC